MLTRTPHAPDSMSRRAMAQRRIRRTASSRLFCSTNGCATYLVVDEAGGAATCPICGLRRTIRREVAAEVRRAN